MSENKKEEAKQISPYVETRNLDDIANKTGNLYKSLNIIAKRATQLNATLKQELHKKLEEFASTTDNLEEIFENREQIEISKFYEKMPKPTLVAFNEFMNDQLYYREMEPEAEKA